MIFRLFYIFLSITFSVYSQNQVESISYDYFLELSKSDNFKIIDVRTPEEFNENRLFDSSNFNFYDSDFLERFKVFNLSDNLLIYCRSGRRSLIASKMLNEMGFENIFDLKGGVLYLDDSILDFTTLKN